jgi:hypothetical protein
LPDAWQRFDAASNPVRPLKKEQQWNFNQKPRTFDPFGEKFHHFAVIFHQKHQNPTKIIKCLISEVKFFTF